jgi:tetratricopeptide (TPR) repeat protein
MISSLSQELTDNAKPILVFIDDAHELSAKTAASGQAASVLTRFAQGIVAREKHPQIYSDIKPAVLVYASRSSDLFSEAVINAGKSMETITLKPFSKDEVKTYLSATPVFRKKPPADWQIEAIFRQTGGNPGELVEALETIDSEGLVFDAAGEIVFSDLAVKKKQEKGPPPSTHERLLAQYKGLSDAEGELVELVACMRFKPVLPPAELSEIIALNDRDTTVQTLSALVQKGILEKAPASKSYSFFNNDYMPNLIHEEMDPTRRGLLHDAIAKRLEAKSERNSSSVRMHKAYSCDVDSAIRNCIELGRYFLFREGKDEIAIELFKRATGLFDDSRWKLRAYILLMITKALHLRDDSTEAWQAIRAGMTLVKDKSTHWETIFELERIHYLLRMKKNEDAKGLINDLKLKLSKTKIDVSALRLLNYEGRYHYESALENPEHASEYMKRALACCEKSEALENEMFGERGCDTIDNNSLYLILHHQGDYARAAQKLERQLTSKRYSISALNNAYLTLAEIYRFAGQHDLALGWAKKALESAKQHELVRLILDTHAILAYLYYDMDEYEKSIEECNHQIAAYACIETADNHKFNSIRLWSLLGHCYKELKVWDKASVYFEEAIGSGVANSSVMSAYLGLGEVCFQLKKYDQELECFDNAEKMLSGMPENTWVASHRYRIVQLKIETYIAKNETEKARQLLPILERLMGNDRKRIDDYKKLADRVGHA